MFYTIKTTIGTSHVGKLYHNSHENAEIFFCAENKSGSTHIEKYVHNYYSTTSEKKVKTKN